MTKLKTILVSEATNIQLNWLVATCEGVSLDSYLMALDYMKKRRPDPLVDEVSAHHAYEYSTQWGCGGPIIERERLCARPLKEVWGCWVTDLYGDIHALSLSGFGPTPLIAAMRCYVASKLGNEVEMPEELI